MDPLYSFQLGCFSTALQVIIAAKGGHKEEWEQSRKDMFHKALFYHFMNNCGLIFAYFQRKTDSNLNQKSLSSMMFFTGSLLFSFPLYYRCFTNKKKLSFVNPIGGIAMILGWVLLALSR